MLSAADESDTITTSATVQRQNMFNVNTLQMSSITGHTSNKCG